jgi:hypothetical protein
MKGKRASSLPAMCLLLALLAGSVGLTSGPARAEGKQGAGSGPAGHPGSVSADRLVLFESFMRPT